METLVSDKTRCSCRVDGLAAVAVAARSLLDDRDFDTRYFMAERHALHVHDYAGTIRIGRRTFALARGDLTLSPAGVASAYNLAVPGQHWVVHFQALRGRGTRVKLPLHLPLGARANFAIERIAWMARLRVAGQRGGAAGALADLQAAAALAELLIWVARQASDPAPARARPGDGAVERAAVLLVERLSRPLDVPELAREVELTQNYLARRFRERFGVTIPHYLLLRRMEHARALLTGTSLPVGRIAQRVGMADPQHFNKQFRRFAGLSPSAFRAG